MIYKRIKGFRQIGNYLAGIVPSNRKLFGGTVPTNRKLYGRTVPPNSFPLKGESQCKTTQKLGKEGPKIRLSSLIVF